MSDPTEPHPPSPPPPPPPTPAPKPAPQPAEKETFSREYVHELREESKGYRQRAQEAEDKRKEAEAAAAEAAKTADTKIAEATSKADQRIIRAELKAIAIKAGIVDLDGLKLADLSAVKLNAEGDIEGADELIAALKESKPYLFKEVTTTSNPGDPPPKDKPKPFDARTATPEERKRRLAEINAGKR